MLTRKNPVVIRLNQHEHDQLERVSRAHGMRMAEWVRHAVRLEHIRLERREREERKPRLVKAA